MAEREEIRQSLWLRYQELWPGMGQKNRPPEFLGQNKAAERLRRTQAWRLSRCVVVLPDPVLLQVRINALQDGKQLMAVTPALKQGFVRLEPSGVPFALRKQSLGGHAMAKCGKRLLFPNAKPGRAQLMVIPALAVGADGLVLGDGRGVADLAYALLRAMGAIKQNTPVAALCAEEQLGQDIPAKPWDLYADMAVTSEAVHQFKVNHTDPGIDRLPDKLAGLPVVKGVKQMLIS
jgi:5-formyltetrahydrofolate cyclo-ligase